MKKSINTMELLAKAISPKNSQTQTEPQSTLLKHKRTSLIVFDLDGVLLDEYLPELAKLVNKEKEVDEITQQGIRQEIDWKEGLRKRIALLKGLPIEEAKKIAKSMEYHDGVVDTLRQLKQYGHKLAVISGGFDVFEERLKRELKIDFIITNKFIVKQDKINGVKIIVDEHKEKNLKKLQELLKLYQSYVIFVGDGTNDIGIIKSADYAIGLNPQNEIKPFINREVKNISEIVPIIKNIENKLFK
jgi:phosphoserine phosphatase